MRFNRLSAPALPFDAVVPPADSQLESAVFARQEDGPVAVFAPLHYEPGYAYPLLIWLHGPGLDESQLRRVMPLVSMRNYAAVAPRAPGVGPGGSRYWPQSDDAIDEAEACVWQALAAAENRFQVHRSRRFLVGYGCGGTMAVRLALRHPDRFAGAATLGGPLPTGGAPFARLDELRQVPLLIAAGCESDDYDSQQVCRDLRLVHSAGMNVTLRHYPCGQELIPEMLGDLNRWLMEQVTGPPQQAAQATH
ncbi:MAG: alpha/beta hydrolase-fold protein [Pirellulales bacterium]